MDWVLVVSGDDSFQQRSMQALGTSRAVGAVSDTSARRLAGSLRPSLVLVDGTDESAKRFLTSLRLLPAKHRPNAIVIGGSAVGFASAASLEAAIGIRVAA